MSETAETIRISILVSVISAAPPHAMVRGSASLRCRTGRRDLDHALRALTALPPKLLAADGKASHICGHRLSCWVWCSMEEDEPVDDISRLEARIEELAEVCERCRKIILASKVAIASGIACLLVIMFGLFGPSQAAAIGSIAMVLGGIVSLGSNVSTLRQTTAAMHAAEQLRSRLINGLDLRPVGDGTMMSAHKS